MVNNSGRLQRWGRFCSQNPTLWVRNALCPKYSSPCTIRIFCILDQNSIGLLKGWIYIKSHPLFSLNPHRKTSAKGLSLSLICHICIVQSSLFTGRAVSAVLGVQLCCCCLASWLCPSELDVRTNQAGASSLFLLCWNKLIGKKKNFNNWLHFISDVWSAVLRGWHRVEIY